MLISKLSLTLKQITVSLSPGSSTLLALSDPEDESTTILWNISNASAINTA